MYITAAKDSNINKTKGKSSTVKVKAFKAGYRPVTQTLHVAQLVTITACFQDPQSDMYYTAMCQITLDL